MQQHHVPQKMRFKVSVMDRHDGFTAGTAWILAMEQASGSDYSDTRQSNGVDCAV